MEKSDKRILKNTIYLYVRMLVMMGLSFFTTRIVLDKLGVSDYGLNNLVAGFVASFKVIESMLAGSTRRFLAYSLGEGNEQKSKVTFSTAFVIHLLIAIIVVIALETGGLWFLNTNLNIEPNRMWAANVVFQIAVLTTFLSVTQTPFMAAVTAHEKFGMYAYMSIYDVLAKIAVLFLLVYIPYDKLIVYSILCACVSITSIVIYRTYCLRKFEECKMSFKVDKGICKEMLVFSGWNAFGNFIVVLNGQGNNLLLNIFFKTVMNAARGLADTVSYTINQFIGSFLVAAVPQLTKYFAQGDKENFERLIFNISQYTIFLLGFFCVPVVLEIDYVLNLWLTKVPEYTADFIRIGLVCNIVGYSNSMIDQGIVATGKVKEMNLFGIPVYLINLPLVYLVLKLGWYPPLIYFVGSIPALAHFIVNLYILSKNTDFPARRYFIQIFCKNFILIALAFIIPYIVQMQMPNGLIRFLVVCTLSVVSVVAIMYSFAFNKEVRSMVNQKICSIFHIKVNNAQV